jgi:hypothetical protein
MAVGSSNAFDLVVLGAGTGGYTAAFRAAQLGLKVALVDEDKIGGTCLHRGCIPTKALLESAGFVEHVRHAKEFGLVLAGSDGVVLPGEPTVDYAQMATRRDAVVKRMWTGLKSLVGKNKVAWIEGRGRLEGAGRVRVSQPGEDGTPGAGGERILQATDIIIATGSRVKSLAGLTPDGERIITSDEVLAATTLPRRSSSSARAPSARVRLDVPRPRDEGDAAGVPAADRAARRPRGEPDPRAELQPARIAVTTNPLRRLQGQAKDGICLVVGPEGKEAKELRADQPRPRAALRTSRRSGSRRPRSRRIAAS